MTMMMMPSKPSTFFLLFFFFPHLAVLDHLVDGPGDRGLDVADGDGHCFEKALRVSESESERERESEEKESKRKVEAEAVALAPEVAARLDASAGGFRAAAGAEALSFFTVSSSAEKKSTRRR